jgi:uncharacterized protein (TIGR02246 family)
MNAFAATFAEDADFTNVIGMGAIEELPAPMFATKFKETHQTAMEIKIRMLSPIIASDEVRWEMTGALEVDGPRIPLRKGLLGWVFIQPGGRWLNAVLHNQESTPRKNLY